MGQARLLALRPYLPQVRRADQRTRRRAHRSPIFKARRVYVIASPDNLDKNPHPHFANAEDADADRRVGRVRRRARDHGERHLLRRPRSLQRRLRQIRHPLQQRAAQARHRHQLGAGQESPSTATAPSSTTRTPSTSKTSAPSLSAARAHAVLTEGDDIFMATAKYGKGTVSP